MISFSKTRQSSTPTTGAVVPTVTTVVGEALHVVSGSEDMYKALSLTLSRAATLLFVASEAYGYRAHSEDFVLPGDVIEFNGQRFTVHKVMPVAPDGIVICARIVVTT